MNSLVFGNDSNVLLTQEALEAIPAIVRHSGRKASKKFLEFFAVTLPNPNTRQAYMNACVSFFDFLDNHLAVEFDEMVDIDPLHVAAYFEYIATGNEALSVASQKLHLAAVRSLFDFFVRNGMLASNPAHAQRGKKHVVKEGKTPILSSNEMRQLIQSIELKDEIAYRDRALISLMTFTFSRITSALNIKLEDYFEHDNAMWIRTRVKGGMVHKMPVNVELRKILDDYISYAGIDEPNTYLFPAATRLKLTEQEKEAGVPCPYVLGDRQWRRTKAYDMIRRRAKKAGIKKKIGNHSFRGTGITNYIENDGALELAQRMAGHASPRTTKLYDRTEDKITIEEVQKIKF